MSFCKFNAGDLVRRNSNREFWRGKLGLILSIEFTHGDPKFVVKWNHVDTPRRYAKNGLKRV